MLTRRRSTADQDVKTFRHNVIVHWGDTDPASIVFYPNYFSWFDESARLFFDSVGLSWEMLMEKHGIAGLPIVEARAKFMSPSVFRDEIVVESRISEWNEKTFKISHAVFNKGRQAVEGYEIRAWVVRLAEDPSRLKAVPIPAEVRAAFE
jgi:4-hydroxybenzoyl-CoA thioesterase